MKRFYLVAIVVLVLSGTACSRAVPLALPHSIAVSADSPAGRAFKNRSNKIQVEDTGAVIRLLPDDLNGDKHQRFIIRLASGQTVLIVHNIDIAPRVAGLKIGDSVRFYGEYIWNQKGGMVHWTHRDPKGRHAAGWLRHKGKIYQ